MVLWYQAHSLQFIIVSSSLKYILKSFSVFINSPALLWSAKIMFKEFQIIVRRIFLQIAAMRDLSTLKINYCPVTNQGLHNIMAGCPNLTYIRTDGCWISALGMFMAILRRPELIYWSKSESLKNFQPWKIYYCTYIIWKHLSMCNLCTKNSSVLFQQKKNSARSMFKRCSKNCLTLFQ